MSNLPDSDLSNSAIPQTGPDKSGADKSEQVGLPQTAEPQTQGQEAHPESQVTGLQQAPESARNRGEDAIDVASQGSMITSDPPSSLMPEDED